MQTPIFESFYQDRARSGSTDLCINLYPEHEDGPKGPEIGLLTSCPGLTAPLVTVGPGPIRGFLTGNNGLLYVVGGALLYSVSDAYVVTELGWLASSSGVVRMVESPTQILLVDGVQAYVWNFATSHFALVIPNSDTDATQPTSVAYQDGFAVVNSFGTNLVYQSNYNDLSTFAAPNGGSLGATANNAYIQGNANDVTAVFDLKRELWIFKSNAIEIWVNQGAPGFAFASLQGVYIPFGTKAPNSVCRLGESVIWLGSSTQGQGVVYISSGYTAKAVTTHALAQLFQSYGDTSDAQAYVYQRNNHYFYVITFPTPSATFVFDLSTGKWHQRGYFNNGTLERERANCHTFFNGRHIVGDYQNGNIYGLSEGMYTDNGHVRKWVRSWRALPSTMPIGSPMSFDSLQILIETGVTNLEASNPQIMLRWSDDGGYQWSNYLQVPAGRIGETAWRCIQHRLGSTKIGTGMDRVFEISGTDPMSIKITGADLEAGPA